MRKCSRCGHYGHNSRTCISTRGMVGGGVRLFGVQLQIQKSFSMQCLSIYPSVPSTSPSTSTSSLASVDEATEKVSNGYFSYGPGGRTRMQERKKGEASFQRLANSTVSIPWQSCQKPIFFFCD